jgi:SM-20-related protein
MTNFDARIEALVAALRDRGWCCQPQLLAAETVAGLRADLLAQRAGFADAAVGRAQFRQRQAAVRSDATRWLDGATPAQRAFLDAMEALRLALNARLYLGLFDFEAHYAHYPPGAFYEKHLDVFRGAATDPRPRRVLSSVFYLNDAWRDDDGGELLLWDADGGELARIAPQGGSAVFFLSDELPHEVLPARADRYSIAGWFRAQGGIA